jgi:hypothetical protein
MSQLFVYHVLVFHLPHPTLSSRELPYFVARVIKTDFIHSEPIERLFKQVTHRQQSI